MKRRIYTVGSLHCGKCERAIRDGLGGIDGVETVIADAHTNTVDLGFDAARVSDNRIRSELAKLDFPPDDGSPRATDNHRGLARYLLLVVAVAAVALAGYTGYVLYPRFDLPAVEGAAVLGLAAAAGIASFFSPCSFPLLLSILGRHKSNAGVAEALFISESAVEKHVSSIFLKLGVVEQPQISRRVAAALTFLRAPDAIDS